MKKLVVVITRGAYNNILQACQIARVAAANKTQVSLFFRDEGVAKLTLEGVKHISLSEGYRGREVKVREKLQKDNQDDLQAILQELKENGDVKISICKQSVQYFDIKVEDLLPELDEVQELESFWKEEVETADHVLTF